MYSSRSRLIPRWILSLMLAGILAFALVVPVGAGTGTIRYVKWNALGLNNGSSWANAYLNLKTAIGAAVAGDQIWVAAGTYRPTSTTDTSQAFVLKNGVAIYGGFAGTETLLSQRNPVLHPTILSGDIGTVGVATDNSHDVVYATAVDNSAVLDGFEIVGAYYLGGCDFSGALYNVSASPMLRNLTFRGNTAYCGGGVHNFMSSPTLINVTFSGNVAAGGGGMYNENSSSPTLINVTFSGNQGGIEVGGMWNSGGSSPTLINVTFSASVNGGMYDDGGTPHVYDSIFWGNGPYEIFNSSGTPAIANTIVKGGCPSGSTCSGVIDADPKLGALQNNGGFTKTRALGAGSAAIDKGNNSTCASKDQRGVSRPQGLKCDMGAYEVKVLKLTSAAAYDGWLLESAPSSGIGGSMNATASTVRLGDDAGNRQYRSLLSFNTAGLPDASTVILARVSLEKQSLVGTNPFTTHGGLTMDLAKPYFGSGISLVVSDFQAAYTVFAAGFVSKTPSGVWYTGTLTSSGRAAINKTGQTQLRLRFSLHSNGDNGADYLSFFSGNAVNSSNRPKLVLYYNP